MGHHISAVILKGPFNAAAAASFNLRPICLTPDLTLFPLDPDYTDFWAEKLDLHGHLTDFPLLNGRVIHHMLQVIAGTPRFAVIQTDYAGGRGSQAAVAYHGTVEVMPPERTVIAPPRKSAGPINRALRHLGVTASPGRDEFETVGLDQHRDFGDLFDAYHEDKC